MHAPLIDALAAAGVSCPELARWTACTWSDGRDDLCDCCPIGGPDRCESEVIKALARLLARRMSESEHIRAAIVGLWRNECTFASQCGEGEAKLSPVLIHLLEALRCIEGDAGVSAVIAEAERCP